ncbi:MAG: transcriptional regulator [Phycisphaerae bacterium]|nr:MAG: transcriptional regulator [Phycisphaerae bacterium]
MPTRLPRPTDAELQVLSVLWDHGPATVRQTLERMPDGKTRSYTTILTIMQLMQKKGLLKRRDQGRAHVYRAAAGRPRIMRPMLRDLVRKAFGGSPTHLVQQLLDDNQISSEHLAEIRTLLDELKTNDASATQRDAKKREKKDD